MWCHQCIVLESVGRTPTGSGRDARAPKEWTEQSKPCPAAGRGASRINSKVLLVHLWSLKCESAALVGSKEVALGVGLVLQDHAVEFDRLSRVVRIGEAAADHARRLIGL